MRARFGPGVTAAVALLGALALAGPALTPHDPLHSADPAALRLRAPGARVTAFVREDGSLLVPRGGEADPRIAAARLRRDAGGRPEVRPLWFPLGTDALGRDVLARLLAGARVSLLIAIGGVAGAALIALVAGLAAGLARGPVDLLVSRAGDAVLALPRIAFVMVLAALVRPTAGTLALLFAVTGWPAMARLVRADARALQASDLWTAARASGAGPLRAAALHAAPHVLGTLAIAAALRVGPTLLLEASLSFLGFGVPPPLPSWGAVLAEGRDLLGDAWWLTACPGVLLVATVILANRIADGVAGPRAHPGRSTPTPPETTPRHR